MSLRSKAEVRGCANVNQWICSSYHTEVHESISEEGCSFAENVQYIDFLPSSGMLQQRHPRPKIKSCRGCPLGWDKFFLTIFIFLDHL